MTASANRLHEIVIPTDPLPVWYFLFNQQNSTNHIAPHWHRGIELSFTLNGSIDDFNIDGKHYTTSPGTILVVNTQVIHSIDDYHHSKDEQAVSLIFPYNYVANLYPAINRQIIDINRPKKFTISQKMTYSKLQALLTQFYWTGNVNTPTKNLQLQSLVSEILLLALSNFTVEKPSEQQIGERKIYATNRLQLITQYVNNHYQERIGLNEIADECNISKEYLARFFKNKWKLQLILISITFVHNMLIMN